MSDQIVDQRLESLLRQSLKAEVANLPLRVTADQVMDRVTARGLRSGLLKRLQLNRFALQAAAVVVLVVAAFGVGIWVSRPNEIGPQPSPPGYPSPSPSPLASASPLPPTTRPTGSPESLHRWPDTSENAPGLYSWRTGGGDSTHIQGFMHNAYGSGDLTILMNVATEEPIPAETTPVTVGGYEATHRRFDPQVDDWAVDIGWQIDPDDALAEEWIVDIDGTAFVIHLIAREGTSQAELDEAHAIIDSIRIEQYPTFGFQLVFRLTTDDWDSG